MCLGCLFATGRASLWTLSNFESLIFRTLLKLSNSEAIILLIFFEVPSSPPRISAQTANAQFGVLRAASWACDLQSWSMPSKPSLDNLRYPQRYTKSGRPTQSPSLAAVSRACWQLRLHRRYNAYNSIAALRFWMYYIYLSKTAKQAIRDLQWEKLKYDFRNIFFYVWGIL